MTREELDAVLLLAKIEHDAAAVYELANGYSRDRTDPWWLVITAHGPLKIGLRKRVYEVDWSGSPVRAVVTTDEVTKDETHVHASGLPKLVAYLQAWKFEGDRRRSYEKMTGAVTSVTSLFDPIILELREGRAELGLSDEALAARIAGSIVAASGVER